MNEYKLTLLNKNKEIIGYALVSKESKHIESNSIDPYIGSSNIEFINSLI